MNSDIFITSCFEWKWSNWSNMDWNLSGGSGYILRNVIIVGLYIALKLIEYQRLAGFWDICCSEVDKIPEACWMIGCIFLWNWKNIIVLLIYYYYCIFRKKTSWFWCTVNIVLVDKIFTISRHLALLLVYNLFRLVGCYEVIGK